MNKEEIERKIFEENFKKQNTIAKKVLGLTFGIMGSVFILLGIILIPVDIPELGLTFIFLGIFLAIIGIVLVLVIPTNFNYDKYKSRQKKYGYMNMYELSAKIEVLEKRIEALEKENM